ncbi:MAG TPA: MYXO-CTERM sorting domain-containing protein [Polyangiaceae bacterium]|nr:MYXO-CTERM sorting domain-containing protein [Polyangiaceae bacterium]
MFGQISRGLQLTVLALAGQGLYLGCSAADEPGEPEPVASVQQRQDGAKCECVDSDGNAATIICYDTCFDSVTCGSQREPCDAVCKFGVLATPGDKCEAVTPKGDVVGVCAASGVGSADRAGCCPACLTKDYACGGMNDAMACGESGQCSVCEDTNRDDCWQPTCKEGSCIGDETPAPVGNACVVDGGRGRCADDGVCCLGCLTPGGACLEGTAAGACGTDGSACVNCDDGEACDGAEQCEAGSCVDGTPLECDDNNPCTEDSCDEVTGCENDVDVTRTCSDGDGCTTDDECHTDGSCAGTPVTCDDGNDCTEDSCDEGLCAFAPANDTEACDDGSSCTVLTVCDAGECVSASPEVCHDTSNPCKTSSCGEDGLGTCMEINREDATPCDDGNPCTTDDSCQAGVCSGGGETDCDDNNDCTTDVCDAVTGCSYTNVSGECADGNLCTVDDRCQAGQCVGDPVECPAANECTANGQCDDESGLCSLLLVEDGTECGNGGECDTGQCVGEDPVGAGGSAGTGGTGGVGAGGTSTGGTTGDAGAAGETGEGGTGGGSGASASGGTSAVTGGAGGTSASGGAGAVGGAGGTTTGGGAAGAGGGLGGAAGSGGTYTGEDFQREAKGCDCRTAPGSAVPQHPALGLMGLGAMLAGRLRRRKRAR